MKWIRIGSALFALLVIFSFAEMSVHALPIGTIVLTEADSIDPVSDTGVEVQFDFDFNPATNTLLVRAFNNSSTIYAPGISGFGFDVGPTTTDISTWKLEAAYDATGMFTTIGTNDSGSDPENDPNSPDYVPDKDYFWKLDVPGGENGAGGSLWFDYYPNTIDNKDGSLYNPALLDSPPPAGAGELPGGNGNTNFFTEALLEIVFNDDSPAVLNYVDRAFARLQNVGPGGDDSLKLVGDVGDVHTPVPEPTTFLLLGTGILGVAGFSRRKQKKTNK